MGDITLYENRRQKGYSVNLKGEITPENGYYNFLSMTIGPKTEAILYDRNNDLFTVHNGSDNSVNINDINDFATITEGTTITIKSYSVSKDGSAFVKKTQTGEVIPLTINSQKGFSPMYIIIGLIICYLLYYIYTSYVQKKITSSILSNSSG